MSWGFRQFISLLLLLISAGSLASDLTASHFTPFEQGGLQELTLGIAQRDIRCPYSQNERRELPNCANPCHLGVCHFGHCLSEVTTDTAYSENGPRSFSSLSMNLISPLAPFLEGPKRPPRFS